MVNQSLSRRKFVGSIVATSAVTAGGVLLSGCSTGDSNSNSAAENTSVKLPDYRPFQGAKADLAGDAAGVPEGFFSYPASPVAATKGTPATGGTVTALASVPTALPPSVDRNQYWQELNTKLGTSLTFNIAPAANYAAKLATVIAGGDLPDFVFFTGSVPQLPNLLKAKFADLSEQLAGDAIADYSNLATIPTYAWRNAVFNGGIYGIPIQRLVASSVTMIRADIVRARGLNAAPKDAEEFKALCQGLTDARANRWALGDVASAVAMFQEMLGAPNAWRNDKGKFTADLEVEETTQAISEVAALWKAGVFHPDSLAGTSAKRKEWFGRGSISIFADGYLGWPRLIRDYRKSVPDLDIEGLVLPKFGGGGPARKRLGTGSVGFTAIKKASGERVAELLRVANWLASPFGSQEYLFRKFGVSGHDHTIVDGNPTLTSTGLNETLVPVFYVAESPSVLYDPGTPDATRKQHAYQKSVIPTGDPLPTVGLYSDTAVSDGAALTKEIDDTRNAVIQGRQPISAWTDAVRSWRTRGGDKIRAEYEESFEAAQN